MEKEKLRERNEKEALEAERRKKNFVEAAERQKARKKKAQEDLEQRCKELGIRPEKPIWGLKCVARSREVKKEEELQRLRQATEKYDEIREKRIETMMAQQDAVSELKQQLQGELDAENITPQQFVIGCLKLKQGIGPGLNRVQGLRIPDLFAMDTDADAHISKDEVLKGLASMGIELSPSQFEEFWTGVDSSGDGEMIYSDCSLMNGKLGGS